jgi:hypothetical protein
MGITLEMQVCETNQWYVVTFEGPNAERMALDFIGKRIMTHLVHEVDKTPVDYQQYPLLAERLFPDCEHGLSLALCSGPNHYPAG